MSEVKKATFREKQVFASISDVFLQVSHAANVLLLFENNIWTEQYFVHAGDEK